MLRALSLAALCAFAQDDDPGWLIVRGDADHIGTLSFERIGEVYLPGQTWRVVHESKADDDAPTSRLVVGAPSHNVLAGTLGRELGVEWSAEGLRYRGQDYGRGVGLVIVAPDPDGQGLVALLTGADQTGAWECFKTNVNVRWPGFLVTRGRETLASGPLVEMDTSQPVVVRLDRTWDREWAATEGWPVGERALRMARLLVGDATVFQRAGFAGSDLLLFTAGLDPAAVARTRAHFAARDLDGEILEAWHRCRTALGEREAPAPMFHVLYGPPGGTNASNFEPDPFHGRPRVLFNLCALTRGEQWRAALSHEIVHTLQRPSGPRLVDRAVHEGVATHLSMELAGDVPLASALYWSAAELAAAEAREAELLSAFARLANEMTPRKIGPWISLGRPPAEVPGAPSRSAYYVGLLAVRAWLAKHPDAGPRDLLAATTDEVYAALD